MLVLVCLSRKRKKNVGLSCVCLELCGNQRIGKMLTKGVDMIVLRSFRGLWCRVRIQGRTSWHENNVLVVSSSKNNEMKCVIYILYTS